jgi:hypothetical protein
MVAFAGSVLLFLLTNVGGSTLKMCEDEREGYRNDIRALIIEVLGLGWARQHVLRPFGDLLRVPDSLLPALATLAKFDAAEMRAAGRSQP